MDIDGKNVLVLGGAGLVGTAVCRELLAAYPASLAVASRQRSRAQQAAERLTAEANSDATRILPLWGDVFVRAEWQAESGHPRAEALADAAKRRRLIADILDPLDEEIVESSLLARIIEGRVTALDGTPADIVVDCMNTATAVGYQDIYAAARPLADKGNATQRSEDLERLLASLYIPQLVRHIQILHEAMRRAGTGAYLKVGTSGTGGMGLNIPYTHGEEKPSRLLLSKAALAGAQSLLIFLMARTPGAPPIVKEVKPAAVIGWREIGYGAVRVGGRDIELFDCPPERAVSLANAANLAPDGDFGEAKDGKLEGVYIHTGENGQFSASEFAAITALGQMQLITPEEIAQAVLREIRGGNTGRDIVAALDGSVMGPSYRGGALREAALNKLRQLEAEHGESPAFEILGPPRLSKLLFEAHLLKRIGRTIEGVLSIDANALAGQLEELVCREPELRQRMISIGIPILLSDGKRLLRGPRIKAAEAEQGWVELTAENIRRWQQRLAALRDSIRAELAGDTSSRFDRIAAPSRAWAFDGGPIDIGEVVAWVFNSEEGGRRGKD